jgi:dihydrodipicolinate synthase/N-acetylneuraminate lyase
VDLVAACEHGDWKEAVKLQAKVLRVREALKTGPFMPRTNMSATSWDARSAA